MIWLQEIVIAIVSVIIWLQEIMIWLQEIVYMMILLNKE
jgi:hypothetical protein